MTTVYTIGYGGRKPEELIQQLKEKGIEAVVDVRLRPDRASLGIYAKAKDPAKGIEGLFAKANIAYHSLVELGNLFQNYDDWNERYTQLLSLAGDLLTRRLKEISTSYCLLCAEKSADQCHRKIIADYLAKKGFQIEHIE